jgi:hypothetical protein
VKSHSCFEYKEELEQIAQKVSTEFTFAPIVSANKIKMETNGTRSTYGDKKCTQSSGPETSGKQTKQ